MNHIINTPYHPGDCRAIPFTDFSVKYKAHMNRDNEFQPLGKDNAELVWENQNQEIIIKHFWIKHTDPLTCPDFPYTEHFLLIATIDFLDGHINIERDFWEEKQLAIETARKLNNGAAELTIKKNNLVGAYTLRIE